MKQIAVLISGTGSNLKSIIEACKSDEFPAQVSVVASNKPDAKGLEIAKNEGIPTVVVDNKNFPTRALFEIELLSKLKTYEIDLVCLAGFMRVLSPVFIGAWPSGRMLNIHPSLLPKYKGLNTHARAIEEGDKEAGCTVHSVIPELDSGQIILQNKVPILKDDTPETLANRVLEEEHKIYPQAIKNVLEELSK